MENVRTVLVTLMAVKLLFANLYWKTLNGFSSTNSVKYEQFEYNSNVIVYELMLRLYTEFSLKKHAL